MLGPALIPNRDNQGAEPLMNDNPQPAIMRKIDDELRRGLDGTEDSFSAEDVSSGLLKKIPETAFRSFCAEIVRGKSADFALIVSAKLDVVDAEDNAPAAIFYVSYLSNPIEFFLAFAVTRTVNGERRITLAYYSAKMHRRTSTLGWGRAAMLVGGAALVTFTAPLAAGIALIAVGAASSMATSTDPPSPLLEAMAWREFIRQGIAERCDDMLTIVLE